MVKIIGGIIAMAVGVYVGMGMPGTRGRDDRVVKRGRRRRMAKHQVLDWFRPAKNRRSGRRDR